MSRYYNRIAKKTSIINIIFVSMDQEWSHEENLKAFLSE